MNKPHKWHKEICAWADGAEIEYRCSDGVWLTTTQPTFYETNEYRIKPQPKEPQYLYVYVYTDGGYPLITFKNNDDDCTNYIGKIKLEVDDEE